MSIKNIPTPTLADVLNAHKRDIFASLNCIQIGIIQDFDAEKQTASVLLSLKQVINIDLHGVKTLQEIPVILKVPVIVLFGGTGFMSMPIAPGDECLVFFNDREIDNWFVNGGQQTPTTFRMHDITDAFALVGIRSLQKSIATYLTNGIRLSYDGGSAKIDLVENQINSLADLFLHTGNMRITEDLEVEGDTTLDGDLTIKGVCKGNGGTIDIADNVVQAPGKTLSAGNGASGTFNIVTVVNGIVTGGS